MALSRFQRYLNAITLSMCVLSTTAAAQITPPLPRPVDNVRQQVEQRMQERLLQRAKAQTEIVSPIMQRLQNAVQATTQRSLDIVDKAGNTLFTEMVLPDGHRAIQQEWLVIGDIDAMTQLQTIGAVFTHIERLPALNLQVIRFKVPPELDSREALQQVLPAELQSQLDRHHLYLAQSDEVGSSKHSVEQSQQCTSKVKVGMVDTQIDTTHTAFNGERIHQRNFVDEDLEAPVAHGTAVAGLLVGTHADFQSLVPAAELYNGAVFYRQHDLHQGAALLPLIRALNWLVEQQVKVINLSLTGPNNRILAEVVRRMQQQDVLLIAAVGNDGPSAPANFPAAYREAIGVTAVDSRGEVYRWANQGDYVELAALGVNVRTARRGGKVGLESGTSMATPVVAAKAACLWHQQPELTAAEVRLLLQSTAQNIGSEGHNPVYGYGLIQAKN